jgi:hypothetical protein
MSREILLGVALLLAGAAHAQELKCEIGKKYVCDEGGCKPIPATVWNVVNTLKRTYARCDARGCDTYEARIFQSGIFINIEVPGRSTIAKMSTLDEPISQIKAFSFHEVVTQLQAVYVSFGSCKPN